MAGYRGIESLVFKVLTRALQQADITDINVQMAAPKAESSMVNVNAVENRETAVRSAKVRNTRELTEARPLCRRSSRKWHLKKVPRISVLTNPLYALCCCESSPSMTLWKMQILMKCLVTVSKNRLFKISKTNSSFWFGGWIRLINLVTVHAAKQFQRGGVSIGKNILITVTVPVEVNAWVEQAICDVLEGAIGMVVQVRHYETNSNLTGLRTKPYDCVCSNCSFGQRNEQKADFWIKVQK